nr:hypothetical protein [Tanacetum cinerariifolium]
MAETMKQYMSKTRADYGSGIARPKINDKDHFELKGLIFMELRDNTFRGSDHEDANEHIEKVLEIVDLFHVLNINQYKLMLRVFFMSLTGAQKLDETLYQAWERFKELLMKCPQHYLTEMHEVILFCNRLDVPTRQILDSKGVIPTKTAADAKVAIQEMAEYSQKEIKKVNEKVYAAQVGCKQCKGPHYTKDFPLKEEGKPLKKPIILSLVHPFNKEGNIEQQLRDFIKETMQILRIKNEDNQWKNH